MQRPTYRPPAARMRTPGPAPEPIPWLSILAGVTALATLAGIATENRLLLLITGALWTLAGMVAGMVAVLIVMDHGTLPAAIRPRWCWPAVGVLAAIAFALFTVATGLLELAG